MSEIEIDWDKVPKQLPEPRTEMNQGVSELTENSCTMAGAEMQVCQLYDDLTDNAKLRKICKKAIKEDKRDPANWRYFAAANNTVKKYFSEAKNYDTIFMRIDHMGEDFKEWLKRGGLVGMWYRACRDYSVDFHSDSVVEGTGKNWKTKAGWHRTNFYKDWILDNYYWRKNWKGKDSNFYKVLHPYELVENKIYYNSMYIFLKRERIKTDVEKLLQEKREKIQINAFCCQGSLIWKYTENNPTLRKELEDVVDHFRKAYGIKKEETIDEKENKVLLASLQRIKDKKITNQQVIDTMKKLVK